MRRKIGSLHSIAMLLVVGSLSGVLSACGGGSDGGPSSSSRPAIPQDVAEALDVAINADPASTAPDLLDADGSGTPADNTMLEEMADATRATIRHWDDTVYVRTIDEDTTHTFVIYNNKEAAKDTPFSDVYPFDYGADNDAENDSLIVDMDNVGTITSVDNFPITGTRTEVQYSDGEVLAGMFSEAPGTYTCVSACNLAADSIGSFSAIGGNWYFTPDNESYLVPVPDSDYVHFGYWMNESEENGAPVIMVAAIAGGTVESPIGTVQALEGKATYEGSATGVYVKRRVSPDNEVHRRTGGQFTADAMFTATFGGGSVPANDHYSIIGSIDNFRGRNGRSIDSSWSLDLEAALFGSQQSAALTGTNGNVFSGATEGDQGLTGAWNGRFFGPVVVDNDAAMPGNQSTFPSGVAGTFSGHFTNGDVLGAFGAEIAD